MPSIDLPMSMPLPGQSRPGLSFWLAPKAEMSGLSRTLRLQGHDVGNLAGCWANLCGCTLLLDLVLEPQMPERVCYAQSKCEGNKEHARRDLPEMLG